jgi:hypothetical protein
MPSYLGPTDPLSRSRIALASAPIAVTAGDYWQNNAGSLNLEADPKSGSRSSRSSSAPSAAPWSGSPPTSRSPTARTWRSLGQARLKAAERAAEQAQEHSAFAGGAELSRR